jgi:Tol biopolymer transport system component
MRLRARRMCLAAVISTAVLVGALPAWSAGGPTQLTSVGSGGQTVHGDSSTYGVALSGDGRLALFTVDDDALPGADATMDVYVRDRKTGNTRLVSRSTGGDPANASCSDGPAISADGRFVAFQCNADNLAGGTAGLFVRDLQQGTTRLVSRASDGAPALGGGDRPGLSTDGRFVVFESDSANLPGPAGTLEAYVRDLRTGTTQLVSKATDGTPADDNSARYPSISGNGRYAVFWSDSDLLPGNPGTADVYVRDRRVGTTRLASRASNGAAANGNSVPSPGSISGDGRLVAFESNAPNLGAPLTGAVVVRDLGAGTTRVVSKTSGGAVADADDASISANGRYVAYGSDDDDLPGMLGVSDVYRFDRTANKTILVNRTVGGKAANDDSFYGSLSAAGDLIAFTSRADNLSAADDNLYSNTFVRIP